MNLKKMVGYQAAQLVQDGDVVGLGTGSTTLYFIERLGEIIKEDEIEILGIPTSYQSFFLAKNCGIPITSLDEHSIDLAVDGADEVDCQLNLIKGGGAAHTLEKIVDSSADKFVVIVVESKIVEKLGKFPVPIEIIPHAFRVVKERLEDMGGKPKLRMAERKDGPVITDNGNFILDVDFGLLKDPEKMELTLNSIPGVVENGIFTGIVDEVLFGTTDGVEILKKQK